MARTYTRPTLPAPTEALLTFDDEVTFFSVHEDVEKRFPVVREGHVKVARDNTVTIYEKYAKPKRKDAKNRYGHHWLLRAAADHRAGRRGHRRAAAPP
jgi:3,4-dihydroxy-2-butanone 4-phosphate synthase